MDKKRKWIIVAVLAVITLFCLWYTQPVSTQQVMEGMPVDNFSGILNVSYVKNGHGGIDVWKLDDGMNSTQPGYQEMMEILERASFRPHLRNLLGNWLSGGTRQWDWEGPDLACLLFSDGQDKSVTFSLDQQTLIVNRSWGTRSYVYSLCDRQAIQDISALFQKYGTFQDE